MPFSFYTKGSIISHRKFYHNIVMIQRNLENGEKAYGISDYYGRLL